MLHEGKKKFYPRPSITTTTTNSSNGMHATPPLKFSFLFPFSSLLVPAHFPALVITIKQYAVFVGSLESYTSYKKSFKFCD